ncbi:MAG: hypothetical protein JXB20_04650, partial [Bacilli bacterium]|nr:hypothetical protein [Bacilli bacterium]
ELDDSDYLGTYQSLIRFQEHFPEQEVVFLIGADNLPKLHKWINAKSLLSEFRFVVVNRSSNNLHESIENDTFLQEYQDRFIILPSFNSEMSSTKFRDTFNKQLVHPEVYAYIQAHGLYRG